MYNDNPTVSASFNDNVNLQCSITYDSADELAQADPSLIWSTTLTMDISGQQTTMTNQNIFITTLSLSSVDSSFCGDFICTAGDIQTAGTSMTTSSVDVGE